MATTMIPFQAPILGTLPETEHSDITAGSDAAEAPRPSLGPRLSPRPRSLQTRSGDTAERRMAVPAHLGLGRPYERANSAGLTVPPDSRLCMKYIVWSMYALKATSFTRVGFRPYK